jgi:uncharacterized protein YyaL (SSP411 family)
MAHESFEDDATAALMNRLFVNVKVDREERPDVDAVYMEAVQAQTGRGGWPMTAFLTPGGKPFFGGTYFPDERRHGMPAFREVCAAIDDAWRNRRGQVESQAEELAGALGRDLGAPATDRAGRAEDHQALVPLIAEAAGQLAGQADAEWGGFGGAPKFPAAMAVDFLLRWYARRGSPGARRTACTALDAMAAGGIYDHLGGGFARYSTDREWLVPHFEKMLYDNALLVRAYLHAWQLTGAGHYRRVVEETVGYVLRDLAQPGGGWASAEDADSEGVEGRFYVWTPAELEAALGAPLAAEVAAFYDVTDAGNFEGASILNRRRQRDGWDIPPSVQQARPVLLEQRGRRVRPGLDDKCLTEWNALMLAALAEAAAAFGRADWRDAALANGEFLQRELRRADGRWLRSWRAGSGASPVLGYAADHACVVDAFVRLGELSGQRRWIDAARDSADRLLELFWDDEHGGFFTTGSDAEALITRPKELMDNAVPAADSTAAVALRRLGTLLDERRYLDTADDLIARRAELAVQHPTAFGELLVAMELAAGPVSPAGAGAAVSATAAAGLTEIVIVGERPDLLDTVRSRWRPHAVLAWGEPYDSPLWADRQLGRAYVCEAATCRTPADDPATLAAQLEPPAGSRS